MEEAIAYSDALVPQMVEEINTALAEMVKAGARYGREEIDAALAKAKEHCKEKISEEAAKNVQELREWMSTQL